MKSIVQDEENRCFLCGRWSNYLETHHIFGGPNRKLSDQDGLTVRLCATCHRLGPSAAHKSSATQHYLHYAGREAYLRTHTPEEFLERYGRMYEIDT